MKFKILAFLVFIFGVSFTNKSNDMRNCLAEQGWLTSFKNFRNALYNNDIKTLKTFFTFPIKGNNAELFWMYVDNNLGKKVNFTEKDFEKHYKKIFDKNFLACLQKVKTSILLKQKKFEVDYVVSKNEKYNFNIYKEKGALYFSLNENSYDPVNDYPIEFSKMFIFKIISNKLLFYSTNAAG